MKNLLTTKLSRSELSGILSRHPVKSPLPPLGDERWARAFGNPLITKVLESIRQRETEERHAPLPELTDELYRSYHLTGQRLPFEKTYYERRRRLARAAICLLAANGEPGDVQSSFIAKLRAILADESWCLPAHIKDGDKIPTGRDPMEIDLFGAETANLMGECLAIFADIIPAELQEQIKARLHRDFFANYLAGPARFWWTQWMNNWVSVCHQGILGAALAVSDTDTVAAMLEHAVNYLNRYIGSFGDDGACEEGPAYWNYGFGWFAVLSEQLEARTNNELSLLASHPKIAAIATYGPAVSWRNGRVVNFSDCIPDAYLRPAILQYLGGQLHNQACLQQAALNYDYILNHSINLDEARSDLFYWLRFFLYCPQQLDCSQQNTKPDAYFRDLQEWMVNGTDASGHAWEFAAKGGNNGVPHNHNDLGSFILNIDGISLISEIGAPMYTAQTFSPRRYELLATRSLGHSVPVISGREQEEGKQYRAEILKAETNKDTVTFTADLTKAYPNAANCEKFIRQLTLHKHDGKLVWRDEINLSANGDCEECLITDAGDVRIENPALLVIRKNGLVLRLTANEEAFWSRIERHEYDAHRGERAFVHRLVMLPKHAGKKLQFGATLQLG
ncbi:MAG: heparinase II/III-family protein [Verrucomicrobiales bacterium]|nr:heparinase II/III-family protein [Verrucomicrobiales bacterium]